MKHRIGFNRLSRKTSHRKALLRNMVTSLFTHERITTTKAKALETRRMAEKMITRAKADSVHNRRMIARSIWDKGIINKLFTEIGPKFVGRNGGYTRILKIGHRQGDAAEMVILELIKEEEAPKEKKAKKAPAAKKAAPKKEEAKAEVKVKDESVAEESVIEKAETPAAVEAESTEEKAADSE